MKNLILSALLFSSCITLNAQTNEYFKVDTFEYHSPYNDWPLNDGTLMDIDSDGDLDVLIYQINWNTWEPMPTYAFINDGTGKFTDKTDEVFNKGLAYSMATNRLYVADFNGDNRDDAYFADQGMDIIPNGGYQNTIIIQTPGGHLEKQSNERLPDLVEFTHDATVGDIDNDGDIDIYDANIGGGRTNQPSLLINDGNGYFTNQLSRLPASMLDFNYRKYTTSLFVDIDKDGDLDLVLGNHGWPRERDVILLNNGKGYFNYAPAESMPVRLGGEIWDVTSIRSGDFNGDGWPDLLMETSGTKDTDRKVTLMLNNHDGTFFYPDNAVIDNSDVFKLHVADINNDGWLDIIISGDWDVSSKVLLNKGNAEFVDKTAEFGFAGNNFTPLLPGDLDNDGDIDFFSLSLHNIWYYVITNLKPYNLGITPFNKPGKPLVLSPKEDTITSKSSIFTWQPNGINVTSHIQVSRDTGFTDIVYERKQVTSINSSGVNLTQTGKLYWRIRGTNTAGNGEWSETGSFIAQNQAPTEIILSSASVNESNGPGTIVGFFKTIDPDEADKHTYSFIQGNSANDADNGKFSIKGDTLKTITPFHMDVQSSFHIYVQTDDGFGGQIAWEFIIKLQPASLVACYPFTGNAADESGNNHHGTTEGAALTTDMNGTDDRAFYFDGIDDKIVLGKNLGLINNRDSFSIMAWVYPEDLNLTDSPTILGEREGGNNFQLCILNHQLYFSFWSNGVESIFTGSEILPDQWTFITVTYDGQNVKLFMNGKPDNTFPASGKIDSNPATLNIGTYDGRSGWFKGKIDNVSIYDRVLTDMEIKNTFERDSGLPLSVEYYKIVTTEYHSPYVDWPLGDGILMDIDSDGDLDVLIIQVNWGTWEPSPTYAFINDGTGKFTDKTDEVFNKGLAYSINTNRLYIADFNGDNRDDAYFADSGIDIEPNGGYQNSIIIQTPDGHLEKQSTERLPDLAEFTHDATVGDIDNDGDIDIYDSNIGGGRTNQPSLLINDGNGFFTNQLSRLPASMLDFNIRKYTTSLFVDIDKDGDLDLVLGNHPGSANERDVLLINDGAGNFDYAPAESLPVRLGGNDWGPIGIRSGDFNGDGWPDLLMQTVSNNYKGRKVTLMLNNHDGTFFYPFNAVIDTNETFKLHVADINNDGWLDIIISGGWDISSKVLLNKGNAEFVDKTAELGLSGNLFMPLLPGDLDNDGDMDFFALSHYNIWYYAVENIKTYNLGISSFNKPGKPLVLSPKDDTAITKSSLFTWQQNGINVTSQIQVSRNTGFTDIVYERKQVTSINSSKVNLTQTGKLYWRIRGTNTAGNGEWSETGSFIAQNQAPTNILLSSASFDETIGIGSTAGQFTTIDADKYDKHSYCLIKGNGANDADNDKFMITGDTLKTDTTFYEDVQSSFHIYVQTDDGFGGQFAREFIIKLEPSGLVAFYPFTGNAKDVSGNNHHGTPEGAMLTSDLNGIENRAYHFDGVNDKIVLGRGLGLINNTDKFSIMAWVFPEELNQDNSPTILGEREGGDNYQLCILDHRLYFSYWSGTKEYMFSGSEILPNQWTFISVSYDGQNVKQFINGEQDKTFPASGKINSNSSTLNIGTWNGTNGWFKGKLDDIAIYNKALTPEKIQELYNNHAPSAISLSNTSVEENQIIGTLVGSFSTTDIDSTNAHTYSLADGTGSEGNSSFTVRGDKLYTNKIFDFEAINSFSIRVRTNDRNHGTLEKIFEISITNILDNNAPVANAGADQSVNEGAIVTLDGSASSDPDEDPLTYNWNVPDGISLSSTTVANPTFNAPEVSKDSTVIFSMIVNDGEINSDPDSVNITVLNVIETGSSLTELSGIRIYPNPNNGHFTIELTNFESNAKISVFTLLGTEVFQSVTNTANIHKINLPTIHKGIYFVRILNGNQQFTKKIIVK